MNLEPKALADTSTGRLLRVSTVNTQAPSSNFHSTSVASFIVIPNLGIFISYANLNSFSRFQDTKARSY